MSTRTPPNKFFYGAVVFKNGGLFHTDEMLGHVIGFSRNAIGEPIINVRWEDQTESTIHPQQVTLDPPEWPQTWSEEKCVQEMKHRKDTRKETASKRPSRFLQLLTLRP